MIVYYNYYLQQIRIVLLANAGRNCDECEMRANGVSCLTCDEHYFLDLCQPCDDAQCLSCPNAADECEECIDVYYLTDANDCSSTFTTQLYLFNKITVKRTLI